MGCKFIGIESMHTRMSKHHLRAVSFSFCHAGPWRAWLVLFVTQLQCFVETQRNTKLLHQLTLKYTDKAIQIELPDLQAASLWLHRKAGVRVRHCTGIQELWVQFAAELHTFYVTLCTSLLFSLHLSSPLCKMGIITLHLSYILLPIAIAHLWNFTTVLAERRQHAGHKNN